MAATTGGGGLTGGLLNQAISSAMVRVCSSHLGRGPTRAQTFYRGNVVVVMLEDPLTKAERSLAASGKQAAVIDLRRLFQATMKQDLVAAIEELTGCEVVAFMSASHVDPDLAAEVFVLDRPVAAEQLSHPSTPT